MKHIRVLFLVLLLNALPVISADDKTGAVSGSVDAGVGIVDITPTEEVTLAGSPSPKKTSAVKTRLFVRALVLSAGGKKAAIVTLDTLKYPVEQVQQALAKIEEMTGIPAANVIICALHTHRGPLWPYYKDRLVTAIANAVVLASQDLTPCTIGAAKGRVDGVSQCRRVIKDGCAWNRWQLQPDEADNYPSEGPSDPMFDVLVLTEKEGRLKAIVYNFACHAANERESVISADFPGDVSQYVQHQLGYDAAVLFLTGACGDVNPVYDGRNLLGEKLGGEIIRCLDRLEPITNSSLSIERREFPMPGREHPEFKEVEVGRNWTAQLEHYRKTFHEMKKREKPAYDYLITGIRIGNDFAIITNPNELFCSIGLSMKSRSPFKYTMVSEQTNGAHGYVPTAKAFEGGSYETWFGEHSYLTMRAGEIIEDESLEILNHLSSLK